MRYTAAHWGAYRIEGEALVPLDEDAHPSRVGAGWVGAARDVKSRILRPAVRKGWLDGDGGVQRCDDAFVEVSWDRAAELVAGEMTRVAQEHGNGAIFGGSYGWASAGRFHHAQSQLRRFLNLAGGHVASRETYSHAAAEVLWPHVIGMSNGAFQAAMTSLDQVVEHCECLLAFGGISPRTAQIASGGTSVHGLAGWLDQLRQSDCELINVSPLASDLTGADSWLAIRPGTDTALMMGLSYEILVAGRADESFLTRCTSGWAEYRAYLMGESDGVAKSADWAAELCDIGAEKIRQLAMCLVSCRSMISVAWGLQRADHGEQPIWAGLALACIIGQVGQPGTGYAFGYGSLAPVGQKSRLFAWPSVPQGHNKVTDFIPVARVADMLLHPGEIYTYNCTERRFPDIRLVYWAGGNPFHHHQDLNRLEEAWTRPETVIVHENAWTATARRADIVLPATHALERNDIMMSKRDPSLIYMSAMFPAMGEARDDYEIFATIAAKMGLEEAYREGRSSADWLRYLWERAQTQSRVWGRGFVLPEFDSFLESGRLEVPNGSASRTVFGDFVAEPEANKLSTESGRITLWNARLAEANLADCPGHPTWLMPTESLLQAEAGALHLISGQPDTRLHGQNDPGPVSQKEKVQGREVARLHPGAAKARGLQEGDVIRISNARGACLAALRLDDGMREDCLSLPTGAWFDPQIVEGHKLEVHGNPNVLTIDKGSSGLSQGNIAHTALVWAEKWQGALPELSINSPPVFKTA